MIYKQIQEKGILAKLLEKGISILIKKECKKINNLKIDIVASSIEIIKGEINKIYIIAQDINYKNLFFDEIELEADKVKINFKLSNKELNFKSNPIINFKILLSENSLKTILFSNNWNWITDMISKKLLDQAKLEDIKIKDGKLLIKAFKDNKSINEGNHFNLKTENGKIYLENKPYEKTLKIPIEEKVYIKNINIENNLIIVFASSSIDF